MLLEIADHHGKISDRLHGDHMDRAAVVDRHIHDDRAGHEHHGGDQRDVENPVPGFPQVIRVLLIYALPHIIKNTVLLHDTFRVARRAGRVNDQPQVVLISVDPALDSGSAHGQGNFLYVHYIFTGTVFDNVVFSFDSQVILQRNIGGTGLHDSQNTCHIFHFPGETDRHRVVPADPLLHEIGRDAVRNLIQPGVSSVSSAVAVNDCNAVSPFPGMLTKHLQKLCHLYTISLLTVIRAITLRFFKLPVGKYPRIRCSGSCFFQVSHYGLTN